MYYRERDITDSDNRQKFQFEKKQMEFFGHVLNKDGLKPSPDKTRAIKECRVPENKETMRSFLGITG